MTVSISPRAALLLAGLAAICGLVATAPSSRVAPALGGEADRTSYALPPGVLRQSRARLRAGMGDSVTFTVKLTRRAVADGTLELTLPQLWLERSAVSGLRYTRLPSGGSASSGRASVRRSGRVVRFAFASARRDDSARYSVTDRGLTPGVYRLPFRWLEQGRATARGTARVAVYVAPRPPVR